MSFYYLSRYGKGAAKGGSNMALYWPYNIAVPALQPPIPLDYGTEAFGGIGTGGATLIAVCK